MMQNEFLSEYAENGQFLFLNMKSSTGILLRKVSLKYHAEWNENPLLKGVFFFKFRIVCEQLVRGRGLRR